MTLLPKNPEKDPLLSPRAHLPCGPPPWGMLTAVDMVKGAIRWQVPLGSFDPSNPAVPQGALSLGGPIVTAGRLVFIPALGIRSFAPSTLGPARNSGRRSFRQPATPLQ